MPHDVSIIATFAVGFVLAFVFAWIATRLRLPPLVGYLVAGVVIGRFAADMVATAQIAGQLADIGVILLMFGVGLHFSIADLMAVRRIVVGAVVQIAIATALGIGLAKVWGWSVGAGLILGLCLSVASTVVVLKGVEERNEMATANGRVSIGWLVVEDLTMVMVLVLLPALAEALGGKVPGGSGEHGLLVSLGLTLVKVAAFGAIVLVLGPRVLPWILRQVARTGSRELFTLAVLALSLGIAFGSAELFGVSFALGAFFAGVVLNESDLSHKAAANSLPLQDAFAVLFFVSVGMLFDPSILWREPLPGLTASLPASVNLVWLVEVRLARPDLGPRILGARPYTELPLPPINPAAGLPGVPEFVRHVARVSPATRILVCADVRPAPPPRVFDLLSWGECEAAPQRWFRRHRTAAASES